ncbi:MAG: LysR family transcriptional regulator [Corynebacterium sp.]|uniref:LysR family transcriptional regulator n=1 Tax=Corynebacterium sp. TaxID=1720 RepID=UPI0026E05217|nr:LysR family transcriptional regulator [Corynebacterium sp.]MDO5668562.1 LysR family transcriptional regulator [Corynebacterium sp.]
MRLSFVTGTEPDKWFTRFRDRTTHRLTVMDAVDPLAELIDARVDLALVRLPDARLSDSHHVVVLYSEAPGIAVPKDHELTLLEEIGPADIEGEIINYAPPESGEVDVEAVRAGLQVVAANVGVLIAPRPLIKVLSRRQIAHRDYLGEVPATDIALVWDKEKDSGAIQDFVGIAKGRTPNSSRQAAPKRSAREKTLAKRQRRAEGKKPQRPRRRR